ncbi:MAG: hypothetical protein HND48_12240 [Chloroflexi bacterium]|nr:hypothetical protein [Chloroflexota bacterium]
MLGGTSTWVGPIVGGLVMGALPEVLRFLNDLRGVFIGLILLGVILFLPGGLINPAGGAAATAGAPRTSAAARTPPKRSSHAAP